jgi:hypothetical protein
MSERNPSIADVAAFYHYALSNDLLGPDAPIGWADGLIAESPSPDVRVIELSLRGVGAPKLEILRALDPMFDGMSENAVLLVAQLLRLQLNENLRTEEQVASNLRDLYQHNQCAADVLGDDISCIDEYFEPWMPADTDPCKLVREFLERQEFIALPPM